MKLPLFRFPEKRRTERDNVHASDAAMIEIRALKK